MLDYKILFYVKISIMKKQEIKLDKVNYIGIGAIITIPFLSYYIFYNIHKLVHENGLTVGLGLTILFALVLAVIIGFFIVPHIAYKRNENVCVGGVPFPVFYGMATDDACLGASITNYWIANILYLCILFIAIALFLYSAVIQYDFGLGIFLSFLIYKSIDLFLRKVLKVYPIDIQPK